jgi:tetratricopeptide (TPR) repeat protein
MAPGLVLALTLVVLGAAPLGAEDAVPVARSLLAAWHEDPARIDRARSLLEAAAGNAARPETLVELARVWFLVGDFRVHGAGERAAAYEHGIAAARRAIAAAPRNDRAHLWLALNSGRLAEVRGVMRALVLVSTVREEAQTVLKLNPSSVEGLILAASLAAELPPLLGGDRAKAEALFTRALTLEPTHTGGRLELARFYLTARRWGDAQRELQRIVDEPAPRDRPRWTVSERPRARALLADLYERGHISGAPESP